MRQTASERYQKAKKRENAKDREWAMQLAPWGKARPVTCSSQFRPGDQVHIALKDGDIENPPVVLCVNHVLDILWVWDEATQRRRQISFKKLGKYNKETHSYCWNVKISKPLGGVL